MKNFVLWDITPCSPLKLKQCFRGARRLHLQGRRINQTRALNATYFTLLVFLAYYLTLKWRRHVPPKRRLTFNGLHGVISHKIKLPFFRFVLFILLLTSSNLSFFRFKPLHGRCIISECVTKDRSQETLCRYRSEPTSYMIHAPQQQVTRFSASCLRNLQFNYLNSGYEANKIRMLLSPYLPVHS
jgi:chloramphenicol O-acetyltransferase